MVLRAEGLSREFIRPGKGTNRFFAVKEANLTLGEGSLTVLMGRSGSGKSTLLNLLAGLLAPSTGKVWLDGTDLYQLHDEQLSRLRNAHIGVIPQGQTAIHSLNVLENVCLPLTLNGDREEGCARELLEGLGIGALYSAMPSELSGGELRRMAIARALVRKPEVLLADEPTSDLDDENTEIVLKYLKQAANSGTAVLMVTHERDAEAYADRLWQMKDGVLLTD